MGLTACESKEQFPHETPMRFEANLGHLCDAVLSACRPLAKPMTYADRFRSISGSCGECVKIAGRERGDVRVRRAHRAAARLPRPTDRCPGLMAGEQHHPPPSRRGMAGKPVRVTAGQTDIEPSAARADAAQRGGAAVSSTAGLVSRGSGRVWWCSCVGGASAWSRHSSNMLSTPTGNPAPETSPPPEPLRNL
jgi:hypothetical protein